MNAALSFGGLGYAYRPGDWVFRGYRAAAEQGRVLAILGPNGRGKTTLLKVLLGVLTATAGNVTVSGRSAFVPQLFDVSFDYSVLEMVVMGRAREVKLFAMPAARDEQAALEVLNRLGIADLAERSFGELSGGQRQMVILARALVSDADILMLDEPTSSLDLKNQNLVLSQIARLSRDDGLTVIFTTHHPHHAIAVADDVLLMMSEDKFIAGAANDVLTEENLQALYGVPLKRITYEHEDRTLETFVPVIKLPDRAAV